MVPFGASMDTALGMGAAVGAAAGTGLEKAFWGASFEERGVGSIAGSGVIATGFGP